MSNKSSKPKLKVPRSLDEIRKDHDQAVFKAGSLQYQIKVLSDELDKTNARLMAVNHEGAARQKLDADKSPGTPVDLAPVTESQEEPNEPES